MFMQYVSKSVRARFTNNVVRNMDRSSNCLPGSKADERNINNASYQYEEAIKALNTLQSNADAIKQSMINRQQDSSLDEFSKYLHRSGTSLKELDNISFIHVSGTKGKGSTCALIESILRSYGMRTGFFSSPHLISVTERIRINGRAISETQFTNKFWEVFKTLESQKITENDMPMYFKFLTILCFHIFLQEKVDVAILEVGIGGLHDCTNIIRNTPTVGITSLGIDHTNVLGNTIEDIARQKAGIIKTNSEVYTNVTQPSCLKIIKDEALKKGATVFRVPDISQYHWPPNMAATSFNKVIELNGSLAIQLAYSWLRKSKCDVFPVPEEISSNSLSLVITKQVLQGLLNCSWPGRYQTMNFYNFRLHLDGAHTVESIDICSTWFQAATKESSNPKILIFNATGERDSKVLLKILSNRTNFDFACFVPNIPFKNNSIGNIQSVYSSQDQIQRAKCHANYWKELISGSEDCGQIFESIFEAFTFLENKFDKQNIDILVTGSIHLLGSTILGLNEFKKMIEKRTGYGSSQ